MYWLLDEGIDVSDMSLLLAPLVHDFTYLPSRGPQYCHITAEAKPSWSISHLANCKQTPSVDIWAQHE